MTRLLVARERADETALAAILRVKARMQRRALAALARTSTPSEQPPSLLEWTERYRTIHGQPLHPSALPWLAALYAWGGPSLYVMKASQVFISEWLVSFALWAADIGWGGRGNVLYLFPTQAQMDDFAQARVNKAIEDSPHLAARTGAAVAVAGEPVAVHPRGRRSVARTRLKRVGPGHVYFRGSDNRRQVLSVDADCIAADELEEFKPGVLPLAEKRLGSARQPLRRGGSTPRWPGSGMYALYQAGTRRRFHLRCDNCNHWQHLTFPENLRLDGLLRCARCDHSLDCHQPGEWVAEQPDAAAGPVGETWHVNRLYSPRADLRALAATGYRILEGREADPSVIQEFYNQDLGLPYTPKGASLNDEVLLACVRDYGQPAPVPSPPVWMGVDVGALFHVYVKAPAAVDAQGYPVQDRTRALWIGTCAGWSELDALLVRYDVARCVIDAEPEGHGAAEFAARWPGRVWRCFYPNMSAWQDEEPARWNEAERAVMAHRTRAIDATFARFYQGLEELPRDAPHLDGFFAQMKAPQRVIVRDAFGRSVARYEEGGAADHYAHAATYCELARQPSRSAGLVDSAVVEAVPYRIGGGDF